jgi:hypothetical protein
LVLPATQTHVTGQKTLTWIASSKGLLRLFAIAEAAT